MRRRLIASIWIAAATVPLVAGTILLVGCCSLPFHRAIHRVMPLCDAAMRMMSGDAGDGQRDPSAPAREKQDPAQRIVITVPSFYRPAGPTATLFISSTHSETGYRSFMSLGALRCDHDVGLHVLDETFLI